MKNDETKEEGKIYVCGQETIIAPLNRRTKLRWSSKNRRQTRTIDLCVGPVTHGVYIRPRLDVILLIDIEEIRWTWNGHDGARLNGSNIGRLIWQQIKRGLAVNQAPLLCVCRRPIRIRIPRWWCHIVISRFYIGNFASPWEQPTTSRSVPPRKVRGPGPGILDWSSTRFRTLSNHCTVSIISSVTSCLWLDYDSYAFIGYFEIPDWTQCI